MQEDNTTKLYFYQYSIKIIFNDIICVEVTIEEDNTTTLYFYPSRIKIIIIGIIGVVCLIGGTAMCFFAFKNEDYLISLLGGVIATFFVLMVPAIVKKIIKPLPFLVLTKKEIILNQGTKNPVSIKWKDVERYKIQ